MTTKNVILSTILCLLLGNVFTYGQDKVSFLTDPKHVTEWWFPLIKKHNIDPTQFTFGSNLKPDSSDPNGYIALELGGTPNLKDTILTIKDPVFIIKENEETYMIVTAKTAIHLKDQIKWEDGKIEQYKFNSSDLKPSQSFSFIELQMNPRTKQVVIKNIGLD
jgi:hypothetical protein